MYLSDKSKYVCEDLKLHFFPTSPLLVASNNFPFPHNPCHQNYVSCYIFLYILSIINTFVQGSLITDYKNEILFGDYCQLCFLVQYCLREMLALNYCVSTPFKKTKAKTKNVAWYSKVQLFIVYQTINLLMGNTFVSSFFSTKNNIVRNTFISTLWHTNGIDSQGGIMCCFKMLPHWLGEKGCSSSSFYQNCRQNPFLETPSAMVDPFPDW